MPSQAATLCAWIVLLTFNPHGPSSADRNFFCNAGQIFPKEQVTPRNDFSMARVWVGAATEGCNDEKSRKAKNQKGN